MTSSFQGIAGGGGAFNPSQLGEYASGIRRQNEITQRDTKAFNNSVNANDIARMENAKQAGSGLIALGQLATTLTDELIKKQDEKNKKEMLKGSGGCLARKQTYS